MTFELTGIVKAKLPTETITSKSGEPFNKTLVVIDDTQTTPDRVYENIIPVLFSGKHNDLAHNMAVGSRYRIRFAIRGREFGGKYFSTVEGISVSPAEAHNAPATTQTTNPSNAPAADVLPF